MDLAQLLRDGNVDGFNDARIGLRRVDLFAAELAGAKMIGADLSRANLDKADLTGADLTDASMAGAFLSDVDGTDAIFDGVIAIKAKMRDAWMEGADFSSADFSHGDLDGAVMNKSKAIAARFPSGRLKRISAKNSDWTECDISNGSVKHADFTGSDLTRALLTDTGAGHSVWDNAKLEMVEASGLRAYNASFQNASLRGGRFPGGDFSNADFTGADLRHADFTSANFTGAVLTGAKLDGAVFSGAVLDGVNFEGLSLAAVDLSGMDPKALGLTDAQIASLAVHGVQVDPTARCIFRGVRGARCGDRLALLWLNEEGAKDVLRYAISTDVEERINGAIPVPGDAVKAWNIFGTADGFEAIAVIERATGFAAVKYVISIDGELGARSGGDLGYSPATRPVIAQIDGAVRVLGIARPGGVIACHGFDDEGIALIWSRPMPTAKAFVGSTPPVLISKGGAVMTLDASGLGAPLRAPEAFPGRLGVAIPTPSGLEIVYVQERNERGRGGMRTQLLRPRGTMDVDALSTEPRVSAVAAIPTEDGAYVAWIDAPQDSRPGLWLSELPDSEPELLAELPVPVARLFFLPGADFAPRLGIETSDGRVLVTDLVGEVVAAFIDRG